MYFYSTSCKLHAVKCINKQTYKNIVPRTSFKHSLYRVGQKTRPRFNLTHPVYATVIVHELCKTLVHVSPPINQRQIQRPAVIYKRW